MLCLSLSLRSLSVFWILDRVAHVCKNVFQSVAHSFIFKYLWANLFSFLSVVPLYHCTLFVELPQKDTIFIFTFFVQAVNWFYFILIQRTGYLRMPCHALCLDVQIISNKNAPIAIFPTCLL